MSSGMKNVVINTRERAVSTDINRLQHFAAREIGDLVRYLLDVSSGSDDVDAAGVTTEVLTTTNPLTGEIVNGLLVRPQLASLNLLVDAGVAYIVNPDATPSADDSVYKYVHDAGVVTVGALTMTANASGSARIDVIECQRTEVVTETDSRDIFNEVTDLFNAATITKATQSQLTYRVRLGTPGAGFPGTASNWLPLAVASVPNGATTCDQMTFWDVRPLVSDRPRLMNVVRDRPIIREGTLYNAVSLAAAAGVVEAELDGRIIGGRLVRGSPGTDATTIDLTDAANIDTGFTAVASTAWYLYLVFPFTLPRWVRYTDAGSGSRRPRGCRGIPLASTVSPKADGRPSNNLIFPAAFGFGAATVTNGLAVAASGFSAAPAKLGFFGGAREGILIVNSVDTGAPISLAGTVTMTAGVSYAAHADLVPGTHFPPHAKALHVEISTHFDIDGAVGEGTDRSYIFHLQLFQIGAVGTQIYEVTMSTLPDLELRPSGVSLDFIKHANMVEQAWVPIPPQYPTPGSLATPLRVGVRIDNNLALTSGTPTMTLRVLGWRL